MSMNAAPEIAFSSERGKANYAAARRQYPAQAIVDLKTMRDNTMLVVRHFCSDYRDCRH